MSPIAANCPQLSKMHSYGPVPTGYFNCDQYQIAKRREFTVSTTRDKCVQIGSHIAVVKNLLQVYRNYVVVYQVFAKVGNLFKHPSNVGIYKAGVGLPGGPVARGQPKGRRASQSHIVAGPVGQP